MKKNFFTSKHNTLFSCIGSQCEDNCCESSWKVFVNRSAYEQYETLDKESGSHLLEHIEKRSSENSASQYAQIQFDSNNSSCSFLTNDKWCKIHQEYGDDLLCDTCKYYPRILKQVDDTYYETGTISCPEMARVILLSKTPFEWKPKDWNVSDERTMHFYSVNQNYRKYMQKTIESFLQQSTYSLPQRLQKIGIFINELYTFSDQKRGISKKMKSAKKIVDSWKGVKLKNQENIIFPILLQSILNMEKELVASKNSPRFHTCIQLFKQGMGIKGQDTIAAYIDTYRKNDLNYYTPYFSEHEYILENFCYYYFQHVLFPYDIKELSYRFLFFSIEMALLKCLLVGISGSTERLHPEMIIQVFQSYFKLLHHDMKRYEHYIRMIHTSLRNYTTDYKELLQILFH
ncbi:flagellin lysine-N-methylase [Bacillus cereus]|uniref:flagellin lysine-N-methylase n=1 Tax=Bacillus cereus TaxID=1396 RepID=UPI002406671A|nr:flagellin lysine-N-methylase [Bacillus cereus]MDF9626333.1 flagellin lysine-N-methylase [Bacillus cereus]